MLKSLNLKQKSISIVMLIITILCSIFIYFIIIENRYDIKQSYKENSSKIYNTFNLTIDNTYKFYSARARANLKSFGVKEAIFKGDRERLFKLTEPRFKTLKRENIFLIDMKFYDKSSDLILSMLNKGLNKNSKNRNLIKYANREQKSLYSFDIESNILEISIIEPIFYRDNFLGVLEFSLDGCQILDKIHKILNLHSSIVIKDKLYSNILKKCDSNCHKKNSFEYRELFEYWLKTNQENYIEYRDREYNIFFDLTFSNFKNQEIAKVIVAKDISEQIDRFNYLKLYSIIISIVILSVVYWILKNSFGKMIKSIEEKDKKLSSFVEELEEKVKIRTKEIEATKQKYKNIINSTSEGYWEFDTEFNITYINNALLKLLKSKKEEVIKRGIFDYIDKESLKILKTQMEKVAYTDNRVYEITLKDSEDKLIHTIFNATTIYNNSNQNIGSFIFVTDITHQKQLLNKLEKERINDIKLASIGELSAGITHEINTPLTYIKGNLEMLKLDIDSIKESNLRENLLNSFKMIKDGVDRVANIVTTMREFSAFHESNLERINIYSTIIFSLRMLFNRVKHISDIYINGEKFDINLEINREIFYSIVDKQKIEQVWIILINNALDELSKVDTPFLDRRVDIEINQDNLYTYVKIIDNAGGIDEKVIDRIFEPLVSTKRDRGMGLGLNIAKKIIESNHGEIKAYNDKNMAIFEIKLKKGESKQS